MLEVGVLRRIGRASADKQKDGAILSASQLTCDKMSRPSRYLYLLYFLRYFRKQFIINLKTAEVN